MLSSTHPPDDVRLYWKEARTLARAGHDVSIYMMFNGECPEPDGKISWRLFKRPKNRFVRVLSTWRLLLEAIKCSCNAYHIGDGEILWFAPILKLLRHNRKVVYDAIEPYPQYISAKPWVPDFFREPAFYLVNLYERLMSSFCDSIIAVQDTMAKRFERWNRKIFLVRNFPIFAMATNNTRWSERPKEFVYIGIISLQRKLDAFIELAKWLEEDRIDYKLRIVGKCAMTEIRKIDPLLKLLPEEFVIQNLNGIEHSEVHKLLENVRFGIAFFNNDERNLRRIGEATNNKIFEYMLHGVVPIVTDTEGFSQYIEHMKNGILLPPGREIEELKKSWAEIEKNAPKLSENARKTAEKFKWEDEERNLLKSYE